MDKQKLKRYEIAIYMLLVFLAAILGFVGNYLISQETLKAITVNLASELLAVGIIFFILNRIFLLGDDASSDKLQEHVSVTRRIAIKLGDRFENGLDLIVSEIMKMKGSVDKNSVVLDAIKTESTLADKVQERIEINERLTTLSTQLNNTEATLARKEQEGIKTNKRLKTLLTQLKNAELVLGEKERTRKETSGRLNEKISTLSGQVKNLEVTINRNYSDVGKELKISQDIFIGDIREAISSEKTVGSIRYELNRNLPALIQPSIPLQPVNPKVASDALTSKIVGTYQKEVSGTLDKLSPKLANSIDEVTSDRKKELLAKLDEIKMQILELDREI